MKCLLLFYLQSCSQTYREAAWKFGETLARNALWLTCRDVCSVACVQTHVGLCFSVYVHDCIWCLSCMCTVFANVSVRNARLYLLCTELPKWHVRTLMSGNWDTLSLTNKPMPGGGSKQCAAIALLLSVCPRCHVTEVFSAIKTFSMVQHCVCVCVLALAEAPPWLVILDMLKQSQTHNRSRKQLGPAIVHNSSLNTLCFPLTIHQFLSPPPCIFRIVPPSTTHTRPISSGSWIASIQD